jgi:carbonic anhydrase
MSVIETLTQRNEAFASSRFSADLKIVPSMKTMIIGCVDPRVDPVDMFGLAPGEAAIIRNVGGRSPRQRSRQAMLRIVASQRW